MRLLRELWTDDTGLTTVEYAMLLALVGIAAIVAWQALGQDVRRTAYRASYRLARATANSADGDDD